jgi:ribosomal protein L32
MSARTAAEHKPTELKYEGTRAGIALFSSASKSTGGRNWTYFDVATRQAVCECQAQPGTCWHLDHVAVAFAMTRVAAFLATLDEATLEVAGRAAATIIEQCGATITDLAVYWGAKREWCERRRMAALAATVSAENRCHGCGATTRNPALCAECVNERERERAAALVRAAELAVAA